MRMIIGLLIFLMGNTVSALTWEPYAGSEVKYRSMSFSRAMKGLHGFVGTRVNSDLGLEVGCDLSNYVKREGWRHRIQGIHMNTRYYLPVSDELRAYLGLGLSHLKLTSGKLTHWFEKVSKNHVVPRVLCGFELKVTDKLALRCQYDLELTKKLKHYTFTPHNSSVVSAGVVMYY